MPCGQCPRERNISCKFRVPRPEETAPFGKSFSAPFQKAGKERQRTLQLRWNRAMFASLNDLFKALFYLSNHFIKTEGGI